MSPPFLPKVSSSYRLLVARSVLRRLYSNRYHCSLLKDARPERLTADVPVDPDVITIILASTFLSFSHFPNDDRSSHGSGSSYAKHVCVCVSVCVCICMRSRNSSVGIATDYGLDGRGSIPGRGKRFLPIPQRPDQLWGPPSLFSNGYRRLLTWGQSDHGVKFTIHISLVPKSRMVELSLYSPTRLYGVMLNQLNTGITLPLPYTCIRMS
jgi:hypothetical protein